MLVHGGPSSIEAVRARGLLSSYPAGRASLVYRDSSRARTAARWAKVIAASRPDLLYVVNTAMPGALLACAGPLPFVLDTGDAIYEMAKRAGTTARWKQPAMRLIERTTERRAAAVVVRGSRHKQHLEAQGCSHVEVIRDGFVERAAPPAAEVEALRAQLGLGTDFIVGVMGSLVQSPKLDICYGWDLVEALAKLRDLPVRGVVVGDGPGRPWLEAKARAAGVHDRMTFTGRVPYEDVPRHLRLFDVALSTQTNNLPGQVRTTGKLPEYMIEERYVLASRVGDAALLLPEEMLIDFEGEVDARYPEKLAARVRTLVGDRSLLDARKALPAIARRECHYDVLSTRFTDLMTDLFARSDRNVPR
jgi:glycosyltransferase involved in cell wall biosynthesis